MALSSAITAPRVHRWPWLRRLSTSTAAVLILFTGLLIGARLSLPFWTRNYVNQVLDQNPSYDGQVGDIDIHLWRGAYFD